MANKVVKKDVKTDVKKKGRRLKRSVRKTLGALFLASAIAVAAIPVDYLQAVDTGVTDTNWGTLDKNMPGTSKIPTVTKEDPIYTTGDTYFQFAYVEPVIGGDKVAVILGYKKDGSLPGGALNIPNTVDAYARRSENLGTGSGYTAVSKSGDFLYYRVVDHYVNTGEYEDPPDNTKPKQEPVYAYYPCDPQSTYNWQELDVEDLYYYANNIVTEAAPLPCKNQPAHQWNKNIMVAYIGNQYISSDGSGGWRLGDDADPNGIVNFSNKETKGVFAGAGNIVTLTVGEDLSGIGDYAFYGCTGIRSITLNNGLNTIGVGAFAECINMNTANIDVSCVVDVIGDYAFYRCRALTTFTLPNQVSQIGNSAFESCEALQSFIMGEGANGRLNKLGARAFKNCYALKNISFKSQFEEEVPLSTFAGCSKLEYIEVANSTINFAADSECSFDTFKSTVLPTFYFRGIQGSTLHTTCTDNQVAFSYDDDVFGKVFELTVTEEDNNQIVYRVDEKDNLIYCGVPTNGTFPSTVSMPATIGPNQIKVIDTTAFQNNCNITRITIPQSITGIAAEAFKGCHNLKWVIFTNPNDKLEIGARAFWTQEAVCSHRSSLTAPPVLNFVGPISYSSAPFDYAMTSTEYIDNGDQERTYITYSSGWPYLLEVRYNPDKDENELVNYPTIKDLGTGKYKELEGSSPAYPYLTDEQRSNTQSGGKKYYNEGNFDGNWDNTDEGEVINAALNLVLPEGIEGIAKELFITKEGSEEYTITEANRGKLRKTIKAEGLMSVDDYAFQGHPSLVGITFSDKTESIGYHAFEDCILLETVNLPGTVRTLGYRPFAGCEKLTTVNFGGGPYFVCDNSIIYELSSSGEKDKIVEMLEGRRTPITITAKETEGITAIYKEAFMETKVRSIDLSASKINGVSEDAFAYTTSLYSVTLPNSINGGTIAGGSFKGSSIEVITIPGEYVNYTAATFEDAEHFVAKDLLIICEEGKMAWQIAYELGLIPEPYTPEVLITVRFFYYEYDENGGLVGERQIGDDLIVPAYTTVESIAPELPEGAIREGYTFIGWSRTGMIDADVESPLNIYARDEKADVVVEFVTVVFMDDNGTELRRQTLEKGSDFIIPRDPVKEGYTFNGWLVVGGDGTLITGDVLLNVQTDMTLLAKYTKIGDGSDDPSGSGSPGPGTSGSPNPGTSGSPGPGTSGSPGPGTSGSPGPGTSGDPGSGGSGARYILTVQNGSGSGSYAEGDQPIIIANNPASGQVFDHWSISPEDVKIASTVLSASVITMPAKDVTVTAHYKAGSSSGSGTTGSGNNSQRPNGSSGSVNNGGTTVVIDKNGLSNTGVVTATVNGSSDDFTIKITESAEATEAALRALMAEYGDDLTNIRYFPMDISLYDSTGTYKITDTTGLSVDITLPLPDSMITYAGNNKVASVAGGKIERLGARFSTIQGVSCVTFTAEHFSPYMIYVDLGNLSSGLVSDETPKTGDGIHPKWFLSIGLACLSFVLFMQKDNRKQPKKVKVKVRAR